MRSGDELHIAKFPHPVDVNPDPELARPRATSINGEVMRAGEVDALREVAAYLGLSENEAARQFDEILDGIVNWRQIAAGHGIGPDELERFAPVFDRLAGYSQGVRPVSSAAGPQPR